MKHWIVNTETLLVYSRSELVLLHDEENFETEFDANSYVLTEAKTREDESFNNYIKFATIGANAAMRMKDLTC